MTDLEDPGIEQEGQFNKPSINMNTPTNRKLTRIHMPNNIKTLNCE